MRASCKKAYAHVHAGHALLLSFFLFNSFYPNLQCGNADAKMQDPSRENEELSKVMSLQPGVGLKLALHASPAARTSAFHTSAVLFFLFFSKALQA